MTDQQKAIPPASNRTKILFFILGCYLIATFLYRALVPAHEYPMRLEQVITIGIDALCLIGLIVTRASGSKILFSVALIAGIGLFAIRLTGNASWWTGHLSYALLPR
jgi:hypothetical protein